MTLRRGRIATFNLHVPEMEGELLESGFLTTDGRYCIELIVVVDKETILALSKEKDVRRAIVITGTIMSLFAMETISTVINNSEEVALPEKRRLHRS